MGVEEWLPGGAENKIAERGVERPPKEDIWRTKPFWFRMSWCGRC